VLRSSAKAALLAVPLFACQANTGDATADESALTQAHAGILALGDSVTFGWNPLLETDLSKVDETKYHGYAELLGHDLGMTVDNASCPGESSGSMLYADAEDNGCRYNRTQYKLHDNWPDRTQLAFTTEYLTNALAIGQPPKLITVTLGGNDLLLLQKHSKAPGILQSAIELAKLPFYVHAFGDHITSLVVGLDAIGYAGTMVFLTTYAPDYSDKTATLALKQMNKELNERRQTESRGTEAVLNAVILTSADAARNLREPSAPTKKALARLWETQRADGRWDWLEFGLEPWETTEAAYHGATFAAFAVGTAPGQRDEAATTGLGRLRTYLSANYPAQHLYNRTWALLASTRLTNVLSDAQRVALIEELVRAQREDGGWSLEALGPWKWSKTAPPVKSPGDLETSLLKQSDGYATGLVVYTLAQAGGGRSQAAIRQGRRWLETNQRAIPVSDVPGRAWQAHSLNYDREHGGEKGEPWRRLFMSDTATAFAILALSDGEPRQALGSSQQ